MDCTTASADARLGDFSGIFIDNTESGTVFAGIAKIADLPKGDELSFFVSYLD